MDIDRPKHPGFAAPPLMDASFDPKNELALTGAGGGIGFANLMNIVPSKGINCSFSSVTLSAITRSRITKCFTRSGMYSLSLTKNRRVWCRVERKYCPTQCSSKSTSSIVIAS